jgi:hypothetical protein
MLTDNFESKAQMRSMRFGRLEMLLPLEFTRQGLHSTDARRKLQETSDELLIKLTALQHMPLAPILL